MLPTEGPSFFWAIAGTPIKMMIGKRIFFIRNKIGKWQLFHNRSEQSLVWWLDAHQADIDRGLTAVVGLVLECLEQPRIAGICDIAHARHLAIFAWIQSFYILKGNVVAFTYIIYHGILALRGGAIFEVTIG